MQAMLLRNYCQSNKTDAVHRILGKYPKYFDLTDENGLCFFFALKYQNVKMLNSLLDYYIQKELKGDYFGDKEAKMKLLKILNDNSDHPLVKLSPEIKEIVKSYENQCMAVEDDDGTIIADYYDEDGSDESRDSKESAHHSDDSLALTEGSLALLGDLSARDSKSSEEV